MELANIDKVLILIGEKRMTEHEICILRDWIRRGRKHPAGYVSFYIKAAFDGVSSQDMVRVDYKFDDLSSLIDLKEAALKNINNKLEAL